MEKLKTRTEFMRGLRGMIMINSRSLYFLFKLMATIYYWSLRLRGYRAKHPVQMKMLFWGKYYWLVECD